MLSVNAEKAFSTGTTTVLCCLRRSFSYVSRESITCFRSISAILECHCDWSMTSSVRRFHALSSELRTRAYVQACCETWRVCVRACVCVCVCVRGQTGGRA